MPLTEYIEQHSSPESEALHLITHRTHLRVINPRMLSGHVQGRVLSMISQMIQPQRILELGTFTGYSALCLAEGLTEDGQLLTIEHNDEMEDSIRRNLALSPIGEKVQLLIGDAKEELKRLEQALLEEDDGQDDISQWDLEDALADIPDLPKKKKKKESLGLLLFCLR